MARLAWYLIWSRGRLPEGCGAIADLQRKSYQMVHRVWRMCSSGILGARRVDRVRSPLGDGGYSPGDGAARPT